MAKTGDRWNGYGLNLRDDNRIYFFLVDHGMTAKDCETPADDPQNMWYCWTGDSLA